MGQKYFEGGQRLSRGITLGMRHMYGAKTVVLQVGGAKKADIVGRMYASEPHTDIPGTVIKLVKDGWVVLDEDAAANIDRGLLPEVDA